MFSPRTSLDVASETRQHDARMHDSNPNTRRGPISILWLGDALRPEFAPTFHALAARARITQCADASVRSLPALELSPALVIIAQGFAGEIDDADVLRLRRRFPTAAFVRIVASWCEGELRSLPPVRGVRRYVAHQALPLLVADLDRLSCGLRPDWALPATATDDEVLQTSIEARPIRRPEPIEVGIAAADAQIERWLVDVCKQAAGVTPVCLDLQAAEVVANASPRVVVWDVPFSDRDAECQLHRLTNHTHANVIALASFPRRGMFAGRQTAGVVSVLSKPTLTAALVASIDEASRRERAMLRYPSDYADVTHNSN